MNLLISLGVSISYFASVALLAMSAAKPKPEPVHAGMEGMEGMDMVGTAMKIDHITTYFDSTVLLTMFLLMGKSPFESSHVVGLIRVLIVFILFYRTLSGGL